MQKCVVDQLCQWRGALVILQVKGQSAVGPKNIDLMNHKDDLTETEVVVDLEFCILKFSLLVYLLVDFFLCDSTAIYSISIFFFLLLPLVICSKIRPHSAPASSVTLLTCHFGLSHIYV